MGWAAHGLASDAASGVRQVADTAHGEWASVAAFGGQALGTSFAYRTRMTNWNFGFFALTIFVGVACGEADATSDPGTGATNGGAGAAGGKAGSSGSGGAAGASGSSGSTGAAGAGGSGGSRPFAKLEIIEIGSTNSNKPIEFDVPDEALGFHIASRSDFVGMWGVERVLGPDGEAVFDAFTPKGGNSAIGYGYLGHAGATVPANDQPSTLPPMAGKWQVALSAVPTESKVYIQKTSDGEFHGGELDLHIYIPDGLKIHDPDPMHAITAADAAMDASVQARVDAFFDRVTEFFGIGRGLVEFHAIEAKHLEAVGEAAYGELVKVSGSVDDGQAVHFVWAQTVDPFGGFPVWGISPGIPGQAIETGTQASTLALALWSEFNAAADGLTMVHELGHFLGLNHTTELDGVHADPLTDTAQCAGIDESNLGACPDKSNIMFPAFYGTTGGVGIEVSPTQVAIVRGAPVYRAYASGPVETNALSVGSPGTAMAVDRVRRPALAGGRTFVACGHSLGHVR